MFSGLFARADGWIPARGLILAKGDWNEQKRRNKPDIRDYLWRIIRRHRSLRSWLVQELLQRETLSESDHCTLIQLSTIRADQIRVPFFTYWFSPSPSGQYPQRRFQWPRRGIFHTWHGTIIKRNMILVGEYRPLWRGSVMPTTGNCDASLFIVSSAMRWIILPSHTE